MKRTTIRIPDELRMKIKILAKAEDRSMNQMITLLLQEALKAKVK
ncbi:hypothetical protein LCGC14_1182200 [marine sediment metagenome]|uniref:CopG-like ribbon-helix-helix domain-containing protein n=1 Tax=marine sediment metagenome TaxID=412755 RepID=A0A0F9PSA0_9ZZZZ